MIPRRRAYLDPDEFSFVARILETGSTPVHAVARLEEAVASRVGTAAGVAMSSGRRAMVAILSHLEVGPGDEVVIPAYTLKDLVPLIQGLGATAVPADIDPETFNVSRDTVAPRLTSRTRAILVVHLFGAPCDIEGIVDLGRNRGIPVIEDCAHALGSSVHGRQVGSFGRAAFFSFETTKPVNTFGGGMVVTNDLELAAAVRSARAGACMSFEAFRQKTTSVVLEDLLFRTGLAAPFLFLLATPRFKRWMNQAYRRLQHAPPADTAYLPVQAELGLRKLASLETRVAEREQIALRYRALLAPRITIQKVPAGCRSTWYFLVALLPRDAAPVRRALLLRGIDAGVEDEIADDCAAWLERSDCPVVADVARRAIALPIYEGLRERDLRQVAHTLNTLVAG